VVALMTDSGLVQARARRLCGAFYRRGEQCVGLYALASNIRHVDRGTGLAWGYTRPTSARRGRGTTQAWPAVTHCKTRLPRHGAERGVWVNGTTPSGSVGRPGGSGRRDCTGAT
jgi:hypothetical protein